MLKSKFKLTVALTMSTMFLLSPISASAATSSNNSSFDIASNENLASEQVYKDFDWEAELARQQALFDKFNNEHSQFNRNKSDQNSSLSTEKTETFENVEQSFDMEKELARQKALFDKFNKEHSQFNHNGTVSNSNFPNECNGGEVLVTSEGSSGSLIGHAGIVFDGATSIESDPDRGVHYGDSDDWMSKRTIYILVSKEKDNMEPASYYAYEQLGKPYNWNFFDRKTTDSFYCSQLVWRSYLDGLDIDLCPGAWSFVSPGDILNSDKLEIDYARW